ncbi:unnamed protein product, partial [Boreogadus saida]
SECRPLHVGGVDAPSMWTECRPLHVGGVDAPSMWTECRPLHVGTVCGLQSGAYASRRSQTPPCVTAGPEQQGAPDSTVL